jgi:hypothetical protein
MAEWKSAGVAERLPPEDALASFLSEAYQASLLREEDRSVVCRLILVNPAELGDDAGPPNGLHVLRFEEERPIHEQEIRRLSPTATFYRSLIGVRWDSNYPFPISPIGRIGPIRCPYPTRSLAPIYDPLSPNPIPQNSQTA